MLIGTINGDERYSAIVEPNLYSNAIFQPEVSYTAKYEVADAIAAKVAKVGVGSYADVGTGTSDYSHENASDELITIPYNNRIQESKKMFNIQVGSVGYAMAAENLKVALEKIRVRKDRAGVACLVNEGTVMTDTTATTASNVKEIALDAIKTLADNDAVANVAICSDEFYTYIQTVAASEFDTDVKNFVSTSGRVGMWLGVLWIPSSILNLTEVKYYDKSGTLRTVAFSGVEFVMYDKDAFSMLGNFTDLGIYDGHPTFNGSAAQGELYAGFAVTNALRAVVKTKA